MAIIEPTSTIEMPCATSHCRSTIVVSPNARIATGRNRVGVSSKMPRRYFAGSMAKNIEPISTRRKFTRSSKADHPARRPMVANLSPLAALCALCTRALPRELARSRSSTAASWRGKLTLTGRACDAIASPHSQPTAPRAVRTSIVAAARPKPCGIFVRTWISSAIVDSSNAPSADPNARRSRSLIV
jgi:hypothetical protein